MNLAAKIIFLDFDGPVSNARVTLAYGDDDHMDPVAMRCLNHICAASGAKIVCTATRAVLGEWNRRDCLRRFEQAGLDISHVHHDWSCNDDNGGSRYEQIEKWLKDHPEVTHYAILDDERVADRNKMTHPKMVKAHMYDGASSNAFRRIAMLLDFDLLHAFNAARAENRDIHQFVIPFTPWQEDHNTRLAQRFRIT